MLTRRDLAVRWFAYGLATLLLCLGHTLVLRNVRIWGVMPFLPPLLAAVVGSMEDSVEATVYALALGLCCDLTLAAPLPCLYTLTLPLAALLSALVAKSVLQPGFLCALLVSAGAFLLVDGTAALSMLAGGAALPAVLSLALRETAVSLPLLLPCYPVLRWVHGRVNL